MMVPHAKFHIIDNVDMNRIIVDDMLDTDSIYSDVRLDIIRIHMDGALD